MRLAVVGGGLFGCTVAIQAARQGHEVSLFERGPELMQAASAVNQFRLHRGFHYPRSASTAKEVQQAIASFRAEYGECLIPQKTIYAVAAEGSKVSAAKYLAFCEEQGLSFKAADTNFIRTDDLLVAVEVEEERIDPERLKLAVLSKLEGVSIHLNTPAAKILRKQFDAVVIAAYAGTNEVADALGCDPEPFQFEVIEKPVIQFRYPGCPWGSENFSAVIMDGEFCSIDPYGRPPFGKPQYHVMGHVKHAIHHANTGLKPDVPAHLRGYLNRGVIQHPQGSRFSQFVEAGKQFVPMLEYAQHVGSMFTVRAVLPNRDADDARPTLVTRLDDKVVRVFSGKLGTCVEAARQVIRMIGGERREAA